MSGPSIPKINTQNVQGQDVTSESSDDHFSSASEGSKRLSTEVPQSPIPITRVERVDDTPAHGEVPGTPAYSLRTRDAVPDEIEVVPEGRRSRSATQSRSRSHSALSVSSRPQTPGGSPIPKTVVERVDDKPAHGEVEGTPAFEMRQADAMPDEVRTATPEARSGEQGSSTKVDPEDSQAFFRSMWDSKPEQVIPAEPEQPVETSSNDADDDEDDGFGDDFDDFAEGDEAGDDFGDFDDATPVAAQPEPESQPQSQSTTSSIPSVLAGLPPLSLTLDLTGSELQDTLDPYLDLIFPDSSSPPPTSSLPPLDMSNSSPFLSERSLSLWQQLVSPPPMQPPNWTRSKIRRLFLVSLGVPVDLDEILPPSKQKRLVLPNINLTSPRASTAQLNRLKEGANDSSTSVDSKTGEKKKSGLRRSGTVKGPPPPPDFDANRAMLICRTTEVAMTGLPDVELKDHLFCLEILNKQASKVLEFWLQRKDEALKEKEALEGVIENLVGFVKGRRGGK